MLIDKFDRKIDYLRVSVTDRCNLRCIYCVPSSGFIQKEHNEILRFEEILKLLTIFVSLGIRKIKITGGEPLVRKGTTEFISNVFNISGIRDVSLTTNGILLKDNVLSLKKTGLKRINISMDTLNKNKFRFITKTGELSRVFDGINKAKKSGFSPIKINVVVIKGINDDEVIDFAKLTFGKPYHIRFIEYMPTHNSIGWGEDKFISNKEIKMRLKQVGGLEQVDDVLGFGHAEYFRFRGALGTIGFISPMSNSFCGRCNKIRLTADGKLKLCLHSLEQIDLKQPLRMGASFDELKDLIVSAVNSKPEKWGEKRGLSPFQGTVPFSPIMCEIGG